MNFKTLCVICLGLLVATVAVAQSQQISVGQGGSDSVPQTTVVPVQQTPMRIVENTTVFEADTKGMDRAQKRAYKAYVYAAKIDSIVQTRNYMFFPNTMQQIPAGMIRIIYADFFYFGLFVDHVEVHLPTERGVTQYVEMLNFDSMNVSNYEVSHVQWGWNISFNITDSSISYPVNLAVSTATGETMLTIIMPSLTMKYIGWLWDKNKRDSRR